MVPGILQQEWGGREPPDPRDLRDHPDCSTPSLRTERDTYRNLSCTSPSCLASRGLGELECRRVKVSPAPSSLSLTGMGEALGGPRNVSVRGCP